MKDNYNSGVVCKHETSYLVREMDNSLYCPNCDEKVIDYYDIPLVRTKTWTDINGEHTVILETTK